MKRLAVLVILFVALTAGQIVQSPSSFTNGRKWEFGTNVSPDVDLRLQRTDISARSNVHEALVVPTVYKKELVAPIARRDPVVATVYKKSPVIPDVYKTPVVPTVYKKEPVVQIVRKEQSVIPTVFKVHPVASNIYKSEPFVRNVYKQQAAVPIVHAMHPVVSTVYQFKKHPIHPTGLRSSPPLQPLQDYVPRIVPSVNSHQKVQDHAWNYNPHHAFVQGDVHVVPHLAAPI